MRTLPLCFALIGLLASCKKEQEKNAPATKGSGSAKASGSGNASGNGSGNAGGSSHASGSGSALASGSGASLDDVGSAGTPPAPTDPTAPADAPGDWHRVGKEGGWKPTRLAVARDGHIFTIERHDGALWRTDLATGDFATVGKPDFKRSKFLLAGADALYSIEDDGSLYRIDPDEGRWERVGKEGGWKPTRLATILGDHMYTIESGAGAIWRTDLASGDFATIGKPDFKRSKFLLAGPDALYSIEDDGSLYRIDPDDGGWERVGKEGGWKPTRLVTIVGDAMYSIERSDGALWRTDLASGDFGAVGKPDFKRSKFLLGGGVALHSIEDDGSLYAIQP